MTSRGRFTVWQRPLALALVVLLACATLGALPASARPAGALTFTNLTPPPDSTVPAGPRTIAATVASTGDVGRVALVLNSQPLSFEAGGPSSSQLGIFTERILAPGQYVVQLVAEDSTGARREMTWRFQVQLSDSVPPEFSQADAKIQIVYPHNGAPVTEATLANIGVYLFLPGTTIPVPCGFNSNVRLWQARNNEPARPVALGTKVMRSLFGRTLPAWEFNDVDVSAARDPNNKLFFFATVDGALFGTNNNVWVHGADPRTIFPVQDVATGVAAWPGEPSQIDARIEIVFPHNNQPVNGATLANLGTDLFRANSLLSVDGSRTPYVHLLKSINAGAATYADTSDQIITAAPGGVAHPRWVHNDVDVAAATQGTPPNLVLFRTVVDNPFVATFSNVWAHGSDVRTFFPVQDVPSRSCQP
ncbi:MAG: hypothetical protein ACYC4L_09110 [Chloroflexota bacterium]